MPKFIVGLPYLFLCSFLCSLLVLQSLVFAGEGHKHGPDGSHIAPAFDSGSAGDIVSLTEESVRNLGIELQEVSASMVAPKHSLYGRVIADPRRMSTIAARFNGRVEQVYVLPGEYVKKGTELLKVTPIQVGSQATVVLAPEDGYVTELFVSRGVVFQVSDNLLQISDLSRVLFEGDVFDTSRIDNIDPDVDCRVESKLYKGRSFDCRVETIDARLKGNPPVGHVHVSLVNADLVLKPGMTGQLHLSVGELSKRIMIPRHAVLGRFQNQFAFVRKGSAFIRRSLALGEKFGSNVEVIEGLEAGEQLVVQGHYQLQYAASNAEVEHAHDEHAHDGHEHSHDEHSHAGHSH